MVRPSSPSNRKSPACALRDLGNEGVGIQGLGLGDSESGLLDSEIQGLGAEGFSCATLQTPPRDPS